MIEVSSRVLFQLLVSFGGILSMIAGVSQPAIYDWMPVLPSPPLQSAKVQGRYRNIAHTGLRIIDQLMPPSPDVGRGGLRVAGSVGGDEFGGGGQGGIEER